MQGGRALGDVTWVTANLLLAVMANITGSLELGLRERGTVARKACQNLERRSVVFTRCRATFP
jgi:hypothetical protein